MAVNLGAFFQRPSFPTGVKPTVKINDATLVAFEIMRYYTRLFISPKTIGRPQARGIHHTIMNMLAKTCPKLHTLRVTSSIRNF